MPMLDESFAETGCDSGNALTDNFLDDVGIDQNTLNVGQQLLQAAIVIFEVSEIRSASTLSWSS